MCSFGRAVAFNTIRPGFESSHRQILLNLYFLLTVCRKDEYKVKEPRNGPLFFKNSPGLPPPFNKEAEKGRLKTRKNCSSRSQSPKKPSLNR